MAEFGILSFSVVGAQRHVGQADFEHPGIEYPAQGSGADPDVIADLERPGKQEHERGKDVPEALLGRDSDNDPCESGTDEKVIDGYLENCEHGEDDHDVADAGRKQPDSRPGSGDRAPRDNVTEAGSKSPRSDDARDQQHSRADPRDELRVHHTAVDIPEGGAAYEGRRGDNPCRDPYHPVVLARPCHPTDRPVAITHLP